MSASVAPVARAKGSQRPTSTLRGRPMPWLGMAWYNGLSEAQRGYWHMVAGSCVPADAWAAFKAGKVGL